MNRTLRKCLYRIKTYLFTGTMLVVVGIGGPALHPAEQTLERSETSRRNGALSQNEAAKETRERQ